MTKQFKIEVTKPCLEDWHSMLPAKDGRFCQACQRTVIDFSNWEDEAILQYFLQNQHQRTCGRFHSAQLDRVRIEIPVHILTQRMPVWRKLSLVLLICFGSTLFQAEIVVQGGSALHAQTVQTTGVKSKKKKHVRPFSKKKKQERNIIRIADIHLDGMVRIVPTEPTVQLEMIEEMLRPESIESSKPDTPATESLTPVNGSQKTPNPGPLPAKKDTQDGFVLPGMRHKRKRRRHGW